MVEMRSFPAENYRAFHVGGKTLRLKIDPTAPIRELQYPEFYDVAINNRCLGRCGYCYADSSPDGTDFEDPVRKIRSFFGTGMSANQRPFQVAIGGIGEPTMHPQFVDVLQEFHYWGITPNFTTNGMFVHNGGTDVFTAAQRYCGGVAVSCHPHLWPFWTEAVQGFLEAGVKTNLHVIISDQKSIDMMLLHYANYHAAVDYFVLLPYSATGRAPRRTVNWKALKAALVGLDLNKIAFGANFYPYLKADGSGLKVSLYEPEIMSKFLSLRRNGALYKSSFSAQPVRTGLWEE